MLADGADAGIRSRCARLKCRRGQCSNNKVRRRGPAGCPLLLSSARLPLSPETERDVTLPGHILVPVHAIQANSDERPPMAGEEAGMRLWRKKKKAGKPKDNGNGSERCPFLVASTSSAPTPPRSMWS